MFLLIFYGFSNVFFDFSNVFPLFLWLVPLTPSDGPGGNRYPPSPNCNTVHNPAKPPSRNTLSPRGERDLRTTVHLCPPDPLFSLRSHKATSQPAGLPFVNCKTPSPFGFGQTKGSACCPCFFANSQVLTATVQPQKETSCSQANLCHAFAQSELQVPKLPGEPSILKRRAPFEIFKDSYSYI